MFRSNSSKLSACVASNDGNFPAEAVNQKNKCKLAFHSVKNDEKTNEIN